MLEPILDNAWKEHLKQGQVLEEFIMWDKYQIVILKINFKSMYTSYLYRLLCFPIGQDEPVISLNLEVSEINTVCLGGHIGTLHINYGFISEDIISRDFKAWAVNKLMQILKEGGCDL